MLKGGIITRHNPMMNEPIKLIDREDEVVFTNWTKDDFEGRWNFAKNRKVYRLKAGKSYYLPFYLAEHFAKHLTDKELQKLDLPTDHFSRQELLDKCVNIQQPESVDRMQVREVPMREVRLATQERNQQYIDQGIVDASDIKSGSGGLTADLAIPTAVGKGEESSNFTE